MIIQKFLATGFALAVGIAACLLITRYGWEWLTLITSGDFSRFGWTIVFGWFPPALVGIPAGTLVAVATQKAGARLLVI